MGRLILRSLAQHTVQGGYTRQRTGAAVTSQRTRNVRKQGRRRKSSCMDCIACRARFAADRAQHPGHQPCEQSTTRCAVQQSWTCAPAGQGEGAENTVRERDVGAPDACAFCDSCALCSNGARQRGGMSGGICGSVGPARRHPRAAGRLQGRACVRTRADERGQLSACGTCKRGARACLARRTSEPEYWVG